MFYLHPTSVCQCEWTRFSWLEICSTFFFLRGRNACYQTSKLYGIYASNVGVCEHLCVPFLNDCHLQRQGQGHALYMKQAMKLISLEDWSKLVICKYVLHPYWYLYRRCLVAQMLQLWILCLWAEDLLVRSHRCTCIISFRCLFSVYNSYKVCIHVDHFLDTC